MTWTAGSAFSVDARVEGIGRLDATMRRGGGKVVMMGMLSHEGLIEENNSKSPKHSLQKYLSDPVALFNNLLFDIS